MQSKKIRLYIGIDPTATQLHLGHTVGLRKLQQFADLGHQAIFLFGTDGMGLSISGSCAQIEPHPRNFGAFARILGKYVRDESVLSLEEAIHKMTGLAAKRLGLRDRGFVKPGLAADLVIFDSDGVSDTATFEKPYQYPAGFSHVLVNGEIIIKDGVHTQARSGKVLP